MSLLTSCGNSLKTKEKVQEAILDRLKTKSGLDLNSLDVATTSVSFNRNIAYATVAFHPKADPTVNNGMIMKYTLEERDGKWVVVNVGDSLGHGMAEHASAAADQLPSGHPSVSGGAQLPPGHPTLDNSTVSLRPAPATGQETSGRRQ